MKNLIKRTIKKNYIRGNSRQTSGVKDNIRTNKSIKNTKIKGGYRNNTTNSNNSDLIIEKYDKKDLNFVIWYNKQNNIHRTNGPAKIVKKGDKIIEEHWMRHGRLHRSGGPALVIYDEDGNIKTHENYEYGLETKIIEKFRDQIEFLTNLDRRIKAGIKFYTRTFDSINTKLRDKSKMTVIENIVFDCLSYAFSTIPPLENDVYVYRGLDIDELNFSERIEELAFTSTAAIFEKLIKFMNINKKKNNNTGNKKVCCMQHIRLLKGHRILPLFSSDLTYFLDEFEVLLPQCKLELQQNSDTIISSPRQMLGFYKISQKDFIMKDQKIQEINHDFIKKNENNLKIIYFLSELREVNTEYMDAKDKEHFLDRFNENLLEEYKLDPKNFERLKQLLGDPNEGLKKRLRLEQDPDDHFN
jgi:hypothetical protein